MVLAVMNRTRRRIIIPVDAHGSYRERHGDIPTAIAELTPSGVAHVPTAHMPPTAGMAEIFHVPLNMELVTYVPLGRELEAATGYEIFNFFFTFLHKDIHTKVAAFNASGILVDKYGRPLNMLSVYSPNAHFEDLLLEGLTEEEMQIADHAYAWIYRLYTEEVRAAAAHTREARNPFFNAISFHIPRFFLPNPRKATQYNCYLSEFLHALGTVFAEQIATGYTLEIHLFLCRHAESDPFVERRSEVHLSSRVRSLSDITHYYATQPDWREFFDQKGSVVEVRLPPHKMSEIFQKRESGSLELPPAYLPPPPGAHIADASVAMVAQIRTFFTSHPDSKPDWALHLATIRVENALDAYKKAKNATTHHNLEQAIIHLSAAARKHGRMQIITVCQQLLDHFFPRR